MANHRLSLEVPDTTSKCLIRLVDTSSYNPLVPTNCPLLEITPPGFWKPSVLSSILPGFSLNLTACNLGLQVTNCDSYNNDLSDGVYIIKWSLSPNDQVYVEYNHLRITSALNRYQEVLCCIQRSIDCDPPKKTKEMIKQAQYIRTLLDVAKAKVEYCHSPKLGVSTYSYALSLLETLGCACPGGCGSNH